MQSTNRPLRKADPSTIQNKFLVGYQGWFTCPGDGPPLDKNHHGWLHWFNKPLPKGGRPNTDLWPDLSEYSPSELYPATGLTYKNGEQAYLFSSRNPQTVRRHFHWMAQYGVDGAFLQRFSGQTDLEAGNRAIRDQRDQVGENVQAAAEQEGRVYAIMYDVTGVKPDRIEKIIKDDWLHLINDKKILDSPSYLREGGRPVLVIWGLGFHPRGFTPATTREIVRFIRSVTPGGAYIMAGAPTHWQTLTGDADRDPDYKNIWYNEFDAISPWTVGRYANEEEADRFAIQKVRKDIEALKQHTNGRKVDYIPVVLPGGSGCNLSEGKWPFNAIRRNGGKFLWRQITNVRREGVNIIYGAMWDEYDEGTAYMPVVSSKDQLPGPGQFLALDADGYNVPSDWYMRICGLAAEILRGERPFSEEFPLEDLQNYWSSHPHYEDNNRVSVIETALEDTAGSEEPPPPYTIEAEIPPVVLPSTRPTLALSSRPSPPSFNPSTKPHHVAGLDLHSPSPPIHVANRPRVTETSMSRLAEDFTRHTVSEDGDYHVNTGIRVPATNPVSPDSGRGRGQGQGTWSNSQRTPEEWQSSYKSSADTSFPVPETSGFSQMNSNYPVYRPAHQEPHYHSHFHPHTPSTQGLESGFPNFPVPQTSLPQQPFPHSPHSPRPAHGSYSPQYLPHPQTTHSYPFPQPSTSQFPPPPTPQPYTGPMRAGGSSHIGNDVINYALNTVDKVAGSDARRHIEKGVDSISKTGSKLFNKFTK